MIPATLRSDANLFGVTEPCLNLLPAHRVTSHLSQESGDILLEHSP